jgi:heat shock protein HslJ
MTSRRSAVLSTLAAGLLIAGLAGGSAAQSPAPSGLDGTNWLLGSITSGGTTTPVVSGTNAGIDFVGDAAGGSAGCNRFMASYTADASALTFGPIATTMMACDEATMAFETSYLAALATVASYTNDGTALTMMDASGAAVLAYSAAPVATVEGPWLVTGINNGNDGVESPIDGSNPTVAFSPEGTVEGFGGCNNFSGGYSTDGTAIAIGPLMSTMMSCGEALDTQEFQYLTALQAATVWSINSGALELRDDSGALQVGANSAIGR